MATPEEILQAAKRQKQVTTPAKKGRIDKNIAAIRELRAKGWVVKDIAEFLNSKGVPCTVSGVYAAINRATLSA